MNSLDPSEIKAGKFSPKGGTSDPALFDEHFGKQYVLEVPYQGRQVQYTDPDSLTADGLATLRRLTMAEEKGDPASVSKILMRELREDPRYGSLPDYKDIAWSDHPWADADIHTPQDLVNKLRSNYQNLPPELEQDVAETLRKYGQGYEREREVLFDQPLDLTDARLYARKTGYPNDYASELANKAGLSFDELDKWADIIHRNQTPAAPPAVAAAPKKVYVSTDRLDPTELMSGRRPGTRIYENGVPYSVEDLLQRLK